MGVFKFQGKNSPLQKIGVKGLIHLEFKIRGIFSSRLANLISKLVLMLLIVYQGPVVQSIVSLMSSLRVISLTVLADSIHKATHIF